MVFKKNIFLWIIFAWAILFPVSEVIAQESYSGCCQQGPKFCFLVSDQSDINFCNNAGGVYQTGLGCKDNVCQGSSVDYKPSAPIDLRLNVPLPGQSNNIQISGYSIASYLGVIYNFAIGTVGLLALLMLTIGGIQWLTAGGNSSRISSAKETFRNALLGLALVLGAYSMLYVINPNLLNYSKIPFLSPNKEPASEIGNNIRDASEDNKTIVTSPSTGDRCASEDKVVAASSVANVTVTASDKRLLPDTLSKLIIAGQKVNDAGGKLKVTSMFRTYALQKYLRDCWEARDPKCNEAARPNCNTSPHMLGLAVDACLEWNGINTCSYLKTRYNNGMNVVTANKVDQNIADTQKKLQEIMKEAGFSRYCGEWWHFESSPRSRACEPGVY